MQSAWHCTGRSYRCPRCRASAHSHWSTSTLYGAYAAHSGGKPGPLFSRSSLLWSRASTFGSAALMAAVRALGSAPALPLHPSKPSWWDRSPPSASANRVIPAVVWPCSRDTTSGERDTARATVSRRLRCGPASCGQSSHTALQSRQPGPAHVRQYILLAVRYRPLRSETSRENALGSPRRSALYGRSPCTSLGSSLA